MVQLLSGRFLRLPKHALLLALIVIVLIGALTELGDVLKDRLGDITAELETAGN